MSDPEVTWPPADELLQWRPDEYEIDADDDGAVIAYVSLDDDHRNVGEFWVTAVPDAAGGFSIVVTDDNSSELIPPIRHAEQTLTLGELQSVLDDTTWAGDPQMVGIGHAHRVRNMVGGESRAELAGFVSVTSEVYRHLEQLDRARAAAWAEGET